MGSKKNPFLNCFTNSDKRKLANAVHSTMSQDRSNNQILPYHIKQITKNINDDKIVE